jgi:cell division septation protein DedD
MCGTVFETELVSIQGVEPEPMQSVKKPEETPLATSVIAEKPTPSPSRAVADVVATAVVAEATKAAGALTGPMDDEKGDGECNLLGDFALLVQGALGLLAVSSLAVKRWREHPRRPVKIWFFDASKQVFGSVLLHLANVLMSMLSSGKFDVASSTNATPQLAATAKGEQPNPCSFYLLNLAIDVSPTPYPLTDYSTNITRPPSASPSSSSSSKSCTPAPSTPLSPTPPNPSARATTATRPAQHGGSNNPSSTSSACSS